MQVGFQFRYLVENSVCKENNYQSIYRANASKLRNFLYYRCGDMEKAEDFMHDAFIKLWENCKTVVLDKARAFLFTTANRMFLNRVEHEKVVLSFAKNQFQKDNIQSPAYILEEKEFKQQLEKAISDLPAGQREVFLMNRVDKISFQEIADIQGTTLSAVNKKMCKAVKRLKENVSFLKDRKF